MSNPTIATVPIKASLRNWKIIDRDGLHVLYGQAVNLNPDMFGQMAYSEGDYVFTSKVELIDFVAGYAKTRNSYYKLVG